MNSSKETSGKIKQIEQGQRSNINKMNTGGKTESRGQNHRIKNQHSLFLLKK